MKLKKRSTLFWYNLCVSDWMLYPLQNLSRAWSKVRQCVGNRGRVSNITAKGSLFGRTSRCWISWSNILSSGWSDFTTKSLNGEKTKKQNRHNQILRHSFVSKSNSLFHYFDQLAMTDSFVRLKSRKIPLLLRLSVLFNS